jgi:amino acid adenylation domain-containing protein
MLRRFVHACERYPERNALCVQERHYSYAEFAASTAGILDALDDVAGEDERLIGIVAEDSFLTYAAIFATALSARAFVPVNPHYPAARNAEVVSQAGLRTLICSSSGAGGAESWRASARVIDACKLPPSSRTLAPPESSPDEIAYLLFTSGSTGTPKGVPITHGSLTSFLDAYHASGIAIDQTDRVLQMFDHTFDFSIATYIAPLCRGACVYSVSPGPFKFNTISDLMEQHELTVAPMVPSVLSQLRPFFGEIFLPHLRHSPFCGEALRRELVLEWSRCVPNARITNFYGPTEATVFSLYYVWDPTAGRDKSPGDVVSLGRPMQGMHALVVDPNGEPVARGATGELCLAGAQVTPGYWQDPERTREAFLERDPLGRGLRWYRTGDVAVEDEDGDFAFCGRVDHQVQIEGYRVELGEVESAARALVAPAEVAAVAVDSEHGNTEIHLFVGKLETDAAEILKGLRAQLPSYMVPRTVVGIESIPLSPNGKIDRARLRATVQEKRQAGT